MTQESQPNATTSPEKIPVYRRIRMMTSGLVLGPGFTLGIAFILMEGMGDFQWWQMIIGILLSLYGWNLLYTGFTGRG